MYANHGLLLGTARYSKETSAPRNMDTGVFQSGAEWIDRNALVVAWQNPY